MSSLLLYSRFLTSFLCDSIPLCPQLPIWMHQSHHHLPDPVAFEFFSLFGVQASPKLDRWVFGHPEFWPALLDVTQLAISRSLFRLAAAALWSGDHRQKKWVVFSAVSRSTMIITYLLFCWLTDCDALSVRSVWLLLHSELLHYGEGILGRGWYFQIIITILLLAYAKVSLSCLGVVLKFLKF